MPRNADEIDSFYAERWRHIDFALGPPERRRWRCMTRDLRRFAELPRPWTVLDYGCGSGRLIPLLAPLGQVHAFDVTPTVLETVRERHPDARVVAGDGSYPTPLADNTYDLAICSEVIEHTIDQASMVRDLFRVIRPGGLLLLTTPNARFEARYKAGTRNLQPVENWLAAAGLRRLVEAAGFEVLGTGTLGAHWSNMPYRRTLPYRLAKRVGRRLRLWEPVEDGESWLAGRLGRGITLTMAARKPGATSSDDAP